ncbi:hypothetical protein [Streptomyces anulatus]|uniref:hypothetical protein n=1 Tax=Streptomyces anulatus TaxID=1892 RepID=UPI0039888D0D
MSLRCSAAAIRPISTSSSTVALTGRPPRGRPSEILGGGVRLESVACGLAMRSDGVARGFRCLGGIECRAVEGPVDQLVDLPHQHAEGQQG